MGAGAGKFFDSDDEYEDEFKALGEEKSMSGRMRNKLRQPLTQRIFQRDDSVAATSGDDGIMSPHLQQNHSEEALEFLRNSLAGFFYLQDFDAAGESDASNRKVELVIQLMKRESFKAGTPLIIEGESGDKLFIVEHGELGVTIRGEAIRTIGRGALLGELALVYDCPRSATVMCKTDCSVFSLQRKLFKRVLTVSVVAVAAQRSRWLLNSPELAILSPMNLSRLVASLKPVSYQRGQYLYEEMGLTSQVTLIERGSAVILTSMDLRGFGQSEIDKMFGIMRPINKRAKSVNNMNFHQLQRYLKAAADGSEEGAGEGAGIEGSGVFEATFHACEEANGGEFFEACEVYEGCIIGIGALRGKAGMPNAWRWVTGAEAMKKGLPVGEKAETPITVMARDGGCETATFSIENFEGLFGAINNVLTKSGDEPPSQIPQLPQRTGFPFDMSRFKIVSVLGSGSFGTVTLAEYTHDGQSPHKLSKNQAGNQPLIVGGETRVYALKSLSKTAIIETGQLRHVIDERNILFAMDDPFCLKLYGVYQTPHQIVMVTEAIECGDLWGVIYEEKLVSNSGGIPHHLVPLYAASIIYALAHIHSKLVVFRDLKPENIMIDRHGYPRVIDFGFAKLVPYQKKDEHGVVRICAKTFTLCGTPEYLPPELIFNTGHDQLADLWSFGVVLYEMIMGRTPFAPRKPDNITELFTNIAMAKKNGLLLSTRIDDRAGKAPHARDIITQLLRAEPTDRLGSETSTGGLLKHAYFSTNVNVDEVYRQTIKPAFIPPVSDGGSSATTLQPVRAFNGDQSLFEIF